MVDSPTKYTTYAALVVVTLLLAAVLWLALDAQPALSYSSEDQSALPLWLKIR